MLLPLQITAMSSPTAIDATGHHVNLLFCGDLQQARCGFPSSKYLRETLWIDRVCKKKPGLPSGYLGGKHERKVCLDLRWNYHNPALKICQHLLIQKCIHFLCLQIVHIARCQFFDSQWNSEISPRKAKNAKPPPCREAAWQLSLPVYFTTLVIMERFPMQTPFFSFIISHSALSR